MIDANLYHLELLSLAKAESFFTLIHNNKTRLEDFFAGTVKKTSSLKATLEYCSVIENKIERKTYLPYLIVETKTGQLLGLIDIKNIDWNIPKAELGAFIDAKYEGKGLITHFMSVVINQIVDQYNFKKLFCRIAPRNIRSIHAIKRVGFKLEGTIRCDYKTVKGELVDLNYYGRVF